ncbi:MAG: right-handed parallel beta-helix repeat-containing protein, partial [Candidatus Thorarchaeota archaeon]
MYKAKAGMTIAFIMLLFFSSISIANWSYTSTNHQFVSNSLTSDTYTPHDAILITSDEEFEAMADDEDWPGDGSIENPYIISGLLLTDPTTQPIRIWNTEVHWIFRDNIIEGGGLCGSFIVNTTNGLMDNNTFRFRHNGMAFQDVENLTISSNNIHNNSGHGLEFLGYAIGIVIQDNRIVDNRQSGIQIPSIDGCEIEGNI